MKKRLLFVFLGLAVLFTGCGRLKKSNGNSLPKPPPKDPFYTNTGFRDMYRFPLKYPYEVQMIDNCDDGFLTVSEQVKGSDLDPYSGIPDLKWRIIDLHLHEDYAFFRREDWTYGYLQYSTGEIRLFETEEELKRTCLLDPDDFKPLEYYYKLFEKGTVMYPPLDSAKKKEIRFHVISHFHGLAVKMVPEAVYSNGERGPAIIQVVSGDTGGDIEIETGKLTWGNLSQEAQDWIGKWLPLHRDELLEMWKTRKLKELPPLE
ncbi:MAG: hypothetical protein IKQ16_08055 [Lentisphaeria bacterium]|nr:hypothetical protein [Lentisphaeria bacterium]